MAQQIFISYSRVDSENTDKLIRRLGRTFPDFTIWHDSHLSSRGGQKWWDNILDAIEASDIFLYLLSNDSLESPYCQAEFAEAQRLERPFIAVQLRDRTEIPDSLAEYQYINLANYNGEDDPYDDLVASINRLLPEGAKARRKKFPKKNRTPRPIKQEEVKPAEREDVETLPFEVPSTSKSQRADNIWRFIGIIVALLVAAIGITPQLLDRQDRFNLTQTAAALTQIAQAPTASLTPTNDPVDATLTAIFAEMAVAGAATVTTLAETQAVLATEQAIVQATETAVAIETEVAIRLATQITWTPTPIPTVPTNTPIPTLDLLEATMLLTLTPITSNAQWTPYIRQFDGVQMVLVPAGCFMMGSTEEQLDFATSLGAEYQYVSDEQPVGRYCFDVPFWIDRFEVTNEQFARFGGVANQPNNSEFAYAPRENITWREARDFCKLRGSRLPTEAEWEYAARGPDNLIFPWGNEFVEENVIYNESSGSQTSMVGIRSAGSSWVGAMDMSGNVWEWMNTLYHSDTIYPYATDDGREDDYYVIAPRVIRGGSLLNSMSELRAANRNAGFDRSNYTGLRCARSVLRAQG